MRAYVCARACNNTHAPILSAVSMTVGGGVVGDAAPASERVR